MPDDATVIIVERPQRGAPKKKYKTKAGREKRLTRAEIAEKRSARMMGRARRFQRKVKKKKATKKLFAGAGKVRGAPILRSIFSNDPKGTMFRSIYYHKLTLPIKEKLPYMVLAVIGMLLSVTILSFITGLTFFFIALFVYFMIPEKHKIYRDARNRVMGRYAVKLDKSIYTQAFRIGIRPPEITRMANDLARIGFAGDQIQDHIANIIGEIANGRIKSDEQLQNYLTGLEEYAPSEEEREEYIEGEAEE